MRSHFRSSRRNLAMTGYVAVMTFIVIVLVVASFGAGFLADSQSAVRAAEGLGLDEVRIVAEHRLFAGLQGCGKEDAAAFDVVGINAKGEKVEMTVCVGWPFKGATPRFD